MDRADDCAAQTSAKEQSSLISIMKKLAEAAEYGTSSFSFHPSAQALAANNPPQPDPVVENLLQKQSPHRIRAEKAKRLTSMIDQLKPGPEKLLHKQSPSRQKSEYFMRIGVGVPDSRLEAGDLINSLSSESSSNEGDSDNPGPSGLTSPSEQQNIIRVSDGVWSVTFVRNGTKFGPYSEAAFLAQSDSGKTDSWISSLRKAGPSEKHNIETVKIGGQVFYKTVTDIPPKTELVMSNGKKHWNSDGVLRIGHQHRCLDCGKVFSMVSLLQAHQLTHGKETSPRLPRLMSDRVSTTPPRLQDSQMAAERVRSSHSLKMTISRENVSGDWSNFEVDRSTHLLEKSPIHDKNRAREIPSFAEERRDNIMEEQREVLQRQENNQIIQSECGPSGSRDEGEEPKWEVFNYSNSESEGTSSDDDESNQSVSNLPSVKSNEGHNKESIRHHEFNQEISDPSAIKIKTEFPDEDEGQNEESFQPDDDHNTPMQYTTTIKSEYNDSDLSDDGSRSRSAIHPPEGDGQLNTCTVCGKQFSWPSLLHLHQLTHERELNHSDRGHGESRRHSNRTQGENMQGSEYMEADEGDDGHDGEYQHSNDGENVDDDEHMQDGGYTQGDEGDYMVDVDDSNQAEEKPDIKNGADSPSVEDALIKRKLRVELDKLFPNPMQLSPKRLAELRNFTCDECGKVFGQRATLDRHFMTHFKERGRYKCELCTKAFFKSTHLKLHMVHFHTDKNYSCHHCNKIFNKQERLKRHLLSHEAKHICDICGRTFMKKYKLLQHQILHSGVKAYHCEQCGKSFPLKDRLMVHMRVHSEDNPYKCDECGKHFTAAHALKTHKISHSGERPWTCDICGLSYSLKSHVRRHMIIHNGERSHKCDLCDKSFYRSADLQSHMRYHGDKPYKCMVCGRGFLKMANLKLHESVHTGEKNYHCEVCGDRFSWPTSLKNHTKIHHPAGAKFECEDCNEKFHKGIHLKRHLKKHHSNKV